MEKNWLLALLVAGTLTAQAPPAPAPAEPQAAPAAPETKAASTPRESQAQPAGVGELERLGENGRDLMIMGVDAPGFDRLKRTQRLYAYYLYRAAIAGHDIHYLQNHRFALDIRNLLEEVHEHREGLDPAIAEGVEEYLKLVWAHHGNYHNWNHAKFTPRRLTFKQLQQAVKVARKNGAKFALRKGENADKLLARLKPFIFDGKVEPLRVNQTPGADPVKTSSNGLYDPGITLKDIQALPREDQQRLAARFALRRDRRGRRLVEAEPFRVGGVYGEQLGTVVFWLKKALAYVDNEQVTVEKDGVRKVRFEPVATQKKALEDLIAHLQTGDEAKFKDYSVAWLKTRTPVDYLNGFVEVYKDPRGVIGAYQANVSIRDEALTRSLDRLSASAAYFEARMPWKDEWKRSKVEPPVAEVVNMVVETGDGGPMSAAAYNLPNYADLRKEHGSKNIMMLNIENARSPKVQRQILEAFYTPEDRALMERLGDPARRWLVYLHEVIGHGSGQSDATLTEDPGVRIGPAYSTLEECRADAVALYQFLDPKLVEIGAVKAEDHLDAAKAMLLGVLTGQLRTNGDTEGEAIREAHDRGGQVLLTWLTQPDKDFGVAVAQREGRHFIQVADPVKAREGVKDLLVRLQTFKSMGDAEGAATFLEQWGGKVNAAWQADARARQEALGLPKDTAFVFPRLVPVLGEARTAKVTEGEETRKVLQDATLATGETFAEQQLRFKRWSRSKDLDPK